MIARVLLPILVILGAVQSVPASAGQLLYSTEGNRLRRYDVDTIGQHRCIRGQLRFAHKSVGSGDQLLQVLHAVLTVFLVAVVIEQS